MMARKVSASYRRTPKSKAVPSSKPKSVPKGQTVRTTKRGFAYRRAEGKASRRVIRHPPRGFVMTPSGVMAPGAAVKPVPADKIRSGLTKAKKQLDSIIQDFLGTTSDDYVIRDIELTASFDAEGKFLGFGVGGAASIKIRVAPIASESS